MILLKVSLGHILEGYECQAKKLTLFPLRPWGPLEGFWVGKEWEKIYAEASVEGAWVDKRAKVPEWQTRDSIYGPV